MLFESTFFRERHGGSLSKENDRVTLRRNFHELSAIRERHPDSLVWNRSMDSLKHEWAVHNAFHALGLVRKQSADTDLNWPQPWYVRLGYALVGRIAWRVIR